MMYGEQRFLLGFSVLLLAFVANRAAHTPLPEARTRLVAHAGSCNPDELAGLPGLGPDRLVRGLGYTFVLQPGHRLAPRANSNERLDLALTPLERLVVLAVEPSGRHILVRSANGEACGWIARADMLIEPETPVLSLRYGPRPLPANALGLAEPLGQPRRVALEHGRQGGPAEPGVQVQASPDGPVIGTLHRGGPARVFHVFRTATKSASHGASLLIGVRDTETRLLGWVRAADVLDMPTAMLDMPAPILAAAEASPIGLVRDPPRDQRPTAEQVLVFETSTLRVLKSLAASACDAIDSRDGLVPLLRDIDGFIGRDVRKTQSAPAGLLINVLGLPGDVLPAGLGLDWDELATQLRHATPTQRAALKQRVCGVAARLERTQLANATQAEGDFDVPVPLAAVPVDFLK